MTSSPDPFSHRRRGIFVNSTISHISQISGDIEFKNSVAWFLSHA
jgi:hypothetical protein